MPQIVSKSRWVPPATLEQFIARVFQAAALPLDDAALAARILVEANMRGIDSHGVARVPHYVSRIRLGSINPRPRITTSCVGESAGCVDGDHGLGHLAMHRAAEEAACLARETGAAWISVRNSSHCGALAYYGGQIAAAGMIGLVFTHVDSMVLPHGSKQAFCGTNPLCICVPTAGSGDPPGARPAVCLDMATSRVPWNTVANAALEGIAIAPDWAVDSAGNETTIAERVHALHPMSAYKGSGLGLIIDVLCSLLSGAPYGPDIPRMYGDLGAQRNLGGLVGAIDISKFVRLDAFCDRLNGMLTRWGALPPVEPGGKVFYPGEPEFLIRAERVRTGIPVGLHVLGELDALARSCQLPPLSSNGAPFEEIPPPHFSHSAVLRDSEAAR